MAIKLLAVDLDGTLLSSENVVLPETARLLKVAADQGLYVVMCTGRPLSGVVKYAKQIGLNFEQQEAVVFNGAAVQKLNGKLVISHDLNMRDFETMRRIQHLSPEVNLLFETPQRFYTMDRKLSVMALGDAALTNNQLWIQEVQDFGQQFKFNKANYSGNDKESVDRLWDNIPQWVKDSYSVVRSWDNVVEIGPLGASKGNALHELAGRLQLSDQEVMVFGDQGNDLSMFENQDFTKVAMGNAIDQLKDLADYVTDDNDHEGIAKALKKLIF